MSDAPTSFAAHDGANLALRRWPLPSGVAPRGLVLIVHGLGEHIGRYDELATRLNEWGYAVCGYDQYGHGASEGRRGVITSNNRLLDDLADVVDHCRHNMHPDTPLILLGHSLGGLVVAMFVARQIRKVDALVLSSPALDAGANVVQKLLLSILPGIAPDLCLGNGLKTRYLSHDPAVEKAYRADPLVHDRVSVRLGQFIVQGGAEVLNQAAQWRVPTLLLYAGDDHLVNPTGSRVFAGVAPRDVLTTRCFDTLYHEIFNETDRRIVCSALRDWLETRY